MFHFDRTHPPQFGTSVNARSRLVFLRAHGALGRLFSVRHDDAAVCGPSPLIVAVDRLAVVDMPAALDSVISAKDGRKECHQLLLAVPLVHYPLVNRFE